MMGGRTVSGAMQYAIQLGQSTVPEAKLGGPESPAEMCAMAGTSNDDSERSEHGVLGDPRRKSDLRGQTCKDKQTDKSPEANWADSDLEEEEADDTDHDAAHFRSSITALPARDSDEQWMSYVRQQLGTLFPDFIDGQAGDSQHTDIGISPSGDLHNGDDSNQHEPGFASDQGEDGAIDGAGEVIRSSKDGESGEYPNIHVEIGGLREEIERLRGVVGDLTIGLQNPTRPCQREPRKWTTEKGREERNHNVVVAEAADEDEAAVEAELGDELESVIPDAFMKVSSARWEYGRSYQTAHISIGIVRMIAAAMAESEQSDKEGSVAMTDTEVFSSNNLLSLKAKLRSTLVGNRQLPTMRHGEDSAGFP